ncbi:Uncharacterized protein DAT39_001782 [Clarias magur]|uniref:Uncharacterized protein n=1 Tax=Clarias magur TaxID=1594786 RepID=A0A8J4UHD9_CLAMG|nr:Uncharacterized protein DAT39_001782 [Clarias magur]
METCSGRFCPSVQFLMFTPTLRPSTQPLTAPKPPTSSDWPTGFMERRPSISYLGLPTSSASNKELNTHVFLELRPSPPPPFHIHLPAPVTGAALDCSVCQPSNKELNPSHQE